MLNAGRGQLGTAVKISQCLGVNPEGSLAAQNHAPSARLPGWLDLKPFSHTVVWALGALTKCSSGLERSQIEAACGPGTGVNVCSAVSS